MEVTILYFILFFMSLCVTLGYSVVPAPPNRYLDMHYNKSKGKTDKISYPNRRRTQLYSRNSGRHVQILSGGKVVAKGDSGDKFAGLVVLSNSYGRVRIKGLVTDRYLCFDKRGHLISKKRATSKCIFRETFGKDAFTEYESVNVKGKFLAFSKSGNVRFKGRIISGTKAVQFVERPKPRKMKNRYYRGKGKIIRPWMLKHHKMLARQSKKNRSRLQLGWKNGRVRPGNKRKRWGRKNKKSWKTVEKELKKSRRGRKRKTTRFSSGGIGKRNNGGGRKRKGIQRNRGKPRYGFLRLSHD